MPEPTTLPINQKIDTGKVTIQKLFSDFWFSIPEYQRSYIWGEEEIDELLDDILFAQRHTPDKEYFLGSIVLQKRTRVGSSGFSFACFDVLDGQQRLTTLLLLFAVLRDLSQNNDLNSTATEAVFQKENKFSGTPERVRIEFLIRDRVGDFIDRFIKSLNGTADVSVRDLIDTDNLSTSNMAKALRYLRERIGEMASEDMEQFALYLFSKVIVIFVASESLEDAFRLFTILNDRGVPLSNSDIIKSWNVGEVQDERKRHRYAAMWEKFEGEFGRDEYDRFLGHIRTIFLCDKARENLLKEFERIYGDELLQKGESTLNTVQKYRDLYAMIFWQEDGSIGPDCRFRNLISIMNVGLATDWIPPLAPFRRSVWLGERLFIPGAAGI